MFGYVSASGRELNKAQRSRYAAVYCGICRNLRSGCSQLARFGLSYDMAFLALLHMSLYEPEEMAGKSACALHPLRPWTDNEYIRYAADMNIALGYYKCMDDYRDEGKKTAKTAAGIFEKALPRIRETYPRQCAAIESCIEEISRLERENCENPDLPAGCFGRLMGELLVYREDLWAENLRQLGMGLGRFIYLADAANDYRADKKKNRYNPFIAMCMEENHNTWEDYLVLAMSRCTDYYERLPLVQDKAILDNILYSGVWLEYRRRQGGKHDRSL
jgi:hypothetical protein